MSGILDAYLLLGRWVSLVLSGNPATGMGQIADSLASGVLGTSAGSDSRGLKRLFAKNRENTPLRSKQTSRYLTIDGVYELLPRDFGYAARNLPVPIFGSLKTKFHVLACKPDIARSRLQTPRYCSALGL